jgi:hypothetical protein
LTLGVGGLPVRRSTAMSWTAGRSSTLTSRSRPRPRGRQRSAERPFAERQPSFRREAAGDAERFSLTWQRVADIDITGSRKHALPRHTARH